MQQSLSPRLVSPASPRATLSVEKLMAETADNADKVAIFNSAAPTSKHTLYWRSWRPKGGGEPPAGLKHP
jgi:Fe-Mn family superoxide dismutase